MIWTKSKIWSSNWNHYCESCAEIWETSLISPESSVDDLQNGMLLNSRWIAVGKRKGAKREKPCLKIDAWFFSRFLDLWKKSCDDPQLFFSFFELLDPSEHIFGVFFLISPDRRFLFFQFKTPFSPHKRPQNAKITTPSGPRGSKLYVWKKSLSKKTKCSSRYTK